MKEIKLILAAVIIIIICAIIPFSLRNKNKETNDIDKSEKIRMSFLIDELEELGYYQYIDSAKIKKIQKESIDAGYIFGWEDAGRDFKTDAESLAEGGIPEFYDIIKDFLKNQNVDVSISQEFDGYGYSVIVNNKKYIIYNEEEQESENIWKLSTIRSFSIINNLLRESGSKERLYILYGGNDLRALFLTDEMYKLIVESNVLPEEELPLPVQSDF